MILQTCYDLRHGDKPQYSHDIYGRKNYVITNIEQSQTLFQISDSQNDQIGPQEEEPSIQSNQEKTKSTAEESSDLDEWESEPIKFIATETTKDYVVIVTNY